MVTLMVITTHCTLLQDILDLALYIGSGEGGLDVSEVSLATDSSSQPQQLNFPHHTANTTATGTKSIHLSQTY